jgi:hypothetical protein
MKLFDKRAEFRIQSPRLLRRRGFYQFLGMLIHFRTAVGTNHFGFGLGHFGFCLFQRNVFPAISECVGHPDHFVQKLVRSSHKRGVEQIARFIKKFEDIAEVEVEENGNESQLAHWGEAILNHASAAERTGRDAAMPTALWTYSMRLLSSTCFSRPGKLCYTRAQQSQGRRPSSSFQTSLCP